MRVTNIVRMFNIAERERWIISNPFKRGDSLISVADERKRERILSYEEESRLLAACNAPKRKHLKAIILCALDTGCRLGEILQLHWSDIDFAQNIITVRSENTKTIREREVPITSRLQSELENLWREVEDDYQINCGINPSQFDFRSSSNDC